MGTGEKAAGQKSETLKPGTPWGGQATGECGSKIPRGRCYQPGKVNLLIHSIVPQRAILVPGAEQRLLFGHLSIAGQISTALLGLFAAPPSSRRLCLWWRPHCWTSLGNTVRSSKFLENAHLSLRSMMERAQTVPSVWVLIPAPHTPSVWASVYPLSNGLYHGENHS